MNPNADRCVWAAAWLGYLIVACSGQLHLFLAAWQHPLLFVATLVCAILILCSWLQGERLAKRHGPMAHAPAAIAVLIFVMHAVPLLLITSAPTTGLGSHALIGSDLTAKSVPKLYQPPSAPDTGDVPMTLLYYPESLAERSELSVIGMIHHPTDTDYGQMQAGVDRHLAPALLYRFLISCCAADAMPIYVAVQGIPIPAEVGNGSWVRLTGTYLAGTPPSDLPVLKAIAWEAITAPVDPYLDRNFGR